MASYGVSEIIAGFRAQRSKAIDLSAVPRNMRRPLLNVSRFGTGARALIIVVVGFFLVRAALSRDPGVAHDTRESMLELAGIFQGRLVLMAVALGLIAYAIDQALHARCRRIRSPIG